MIQIVKLIIILAIIAPPLQSINENETLFSEGSNATVIQNNESKESNETNAVLLNINYFGYSLTSVILVSLDIVLLFLMIATVSYTCVKIQCSNLNKVFDENIVLV